MPCDAPVMTATIRSVSIIEFLYVYRAMPKALNEADLYDRRRTCGANCQGYRRQASHVPADSRSHERLNKKHARSYGGAKK
jgi:hypothetical protein